MTLPTIDFAERIEMLAEAKIHGDPDTYLPPASTTSWTSTAPVGRLQGGRPV